MQLLPPALPAPPAPPATRVVVGQGGHIAIVNDAESPTAVYRARVAQRSELAGQRREVQELRDELSGQLSEPMGPSGANRAGIEARIGRLDAQIEGLDKQLAAADVAVAEAAGVPGAVVEPPHYERPGPRYAMTAVFVVVAILPVSIAYARRIWRRGAAAVGALPGELMDRITRLDQAVESIAVEVERIGEGQRFVTRVLAERSVPEPVNALGQGRSRE